MFPSASVRMDQPWLVRQAIELHSLIKAATEPLSEVAEQ